MTTAYAPRLRVFYDTEFIEDGKTIDLISIGMVADDGREYYAVNRHAPWKRIKNHPWLRENVWPHLPRYHGDARLHFGGRPCVLPPSCRTTVTDDPEHGTFWRCLLYDGHVGQHEWPHPLAAAIARKIGAKP